MSMTGRYLRVAPEAIGNIQRAPETLHDVLHPDPEPDDYSTRYLDIDKTWHVIHFLLNGDAWKGKSPLFEAVLGGNALTEEDLGYGPARYLQPAQVAATAEALQRISAEQLWSRYDDARVRAADVYWSNDDEESEDYALENYRALQEFFLAAAKAKDALVVWLA